MHALDMNTGEIVWQREFFLGSFAPTIASPNIGNTSVASGVVVNDGIVIVGGGIGARSPVTGNFPSTATQNSWIPNNVTTLCVPGTTSCP